MKSLLTKITIAHWFLGIGLLFGLMTIYVTPPFQAPDETNHFLRTADIAEGHFMGFHKENRLGGVLPQDYLDVTRHFNGLRKEGKKFIQPNTGLNLSKGNKKVFIDYANVGYYAPTVYLPQSAGIVLSKMMGFSVLNQLYAGRIYGLFFWLIIVFLAIRIIPTHKTTMAFLALLPASISINSSLSGDTVSNALVFLWVSLMVRGMMINEKIDKRLWYLLILISVVITINKLVYLPCLLLVFLIPRDRWPIKNAAHALVVINVLVAITWAIYSGSLFIPYDQYDVVFRDGQQLNPGVNPMAQLKYVMSHPFAFAVTALVSYIESGFATWAHYIGKFGWEKHYIPTWVIGFLSLGIIGQMFHKAERTFSKRQLMWMIGVVVLMTLSFTISIYMQWSPVGNDRVRSLSGRYFIPIGILFFIAVKGIIPKVHFKDYYLLWFNVVGLVALVFSIVEVYY